MTTLTDEELLAWLDCFGPHKESVIGLDRLKAAVCYKRFRELLAQQEWQPIETAPKDWQIFGFGVWQGEINGIGDKLIDIIQGPPGTSDADKNPVWWPCVTGDAYTCWLKATHWRPLPDPPKDG